MSVNATFGLLSGTGTQALQNFMSNSTYTTALNNVSGYNSYTGKNHGFNTGSIFSNSVGNETTSSLMSNMQLTGMQPGKSSSIFSQGGFGTSLVGNYYNSINNVALGQGAPTSVFEQRLAYSMGLSEVPQAYYPDGNYSDEFSLGTTAGSSKSGSSSLNLMS